MEPEQQPEKLELHCKYKEETERCVLNPDSSASKDDPECYKTEKNRCAKNKKKIIKIKPKKVNLDLVLEQEQPLGQQPSEQQPSEQQPSEQQPSELKNQNDFLYVICTFTKAYIIFPLLVLFRIVIIVQKIIAEQISRKD